MPTTDFPFQIEREINPPTFAEIDDRIGGVYVIYNVLSQCSYVGKALSIRKRVRNDHYRALATGHSNQAAMQRLIWDRNRLGKGLEPFRFAVLQVIPTSQYDDFIPAETLFIKAIKPAYNYYMDNRYPFTEYDSAMALLDNKEP
jgi:excinuclease UvrABC nuclease subunit